MWERKIRKKLTRLGIDFGTHLIKAIEVTIDRSRKQLSKLALLKRPSPSCSISEDIQSLQKLFDILKPSTKEVNMSLSAPFAIVRFITMPKMDRNELKKSLEYEAERHIPFRIDEITMDAVILKEAQEAQRQMSVLLAAAKNDELYKRINILKSAGFIANVIDIDGFACFNAFCNAVEGKTENIALLNIGYTYTNMVISRGETPYFSRDIQIGGKDIIPPICNLFGVPDDKPEELLSKVMENKESAGEAISSVLNNLIEECKLSFGYFENQFGAGIDKIYLSGGIATLGIIQDYFEKSLGIRPTPWNPFKNFEIGNEVDRNFLMKVNSIFAVCAGLALRR